ncbi:hypothetical protein [Gandjariella thermophila]|nr:hypothetical protein [Gandjariella thermophila]
MTRMLCAAAVAAGVAVTPVAAAPPAASAVAGTEDCVFVRPFFGSPNTQVRVSGCGFWPNENIQILLGSSVRARTRASGSGEFSAMFNVPGDESSGARNVTAIGQSSKVFARTVFLVANHP